MDGTRNACSFRHALRGRVSRNQLIYAILTGQNSHALRGRVSRNCEGKALDGVISVTPCVGV